MYRNTTTNLYLLDDGMKQKGRTARREAGVELLLRLFDDLHAAYLGKALETHIRAHQRLQLGALRVRYLAEAAIPGGPARASTCS